jgi:uncharacterized BrkB/YihY/UPF0761 family membrane protein
MYAPFYAYMRRVDEALHKRRHGRVSMSGLIVEIFLASILLPAAIAAIAATNTDDWDATAATFWTTYLPILLVVSVVFGIVYPMLPRGKGT